MASKEKVFVQVREDLQPISCMKDVRDIKVYGDCYRFSPARSFGVEAIDTDADSAIDETGNLWIAWTRTIDGRSRVMVACIGLDWMSEEREVGCGDGCRCGADEQEGSPRIAWVPANTGPGAAYMVWTARAGGEWRLVGRELRLRDGQIAMSDPEELDRSGDGLRAPCIASVDIAGKGPCAVVAWEAVQAGARRIAWRARSGCGWLPTTRASAPHEGLCFRPAIAQGPAGGLQIAYDCAQGGAFNVRVVRFPGGQRTEVNTTSCNSMHPAIVRVRRADWAQGVWLAYTSNRRPDRPGDLAKWIRLYLVDDEGKVLTPDLPQPDVNMDAISEDQGWEFPQLVNDAQDRVWIFGRSSHSFHAQFWDGAQWSQRINFALNAWGKRGKHISVNLGRDRCIWLVYEGPRYIEVVKLTTWPSAAGTRADAVRGQALRPVEESDFAGTNEAVARGLREAGGDYSVFFGDLHSHSYYSDGTGDTDEFFVRSKDLLSMDFCALTDHEYFCQKSIAGYAWAEICQMAACMNEPGRFVTFPGYEWTGKSHPGPGHKHVVFPFDYPPLFSKADPNYDDAHSHDLAVAVRRAGGLAIPHHTAWSGVDKHLHDPAVEPLMEICSAHGANEFLEVRPIPPRNDRWFEGHFTQDLIRDGLKFGLCGGTDNHGLLWHHGTSWARNTAVTGLTAVYAKELTREAIWEALLAKRVYATSGAQIYLEFSINGQLMGSEVRAARGEGLRVRIRVEGTAPLTSVVLVRDCTDLKDFVVAGDGQGPALTVDEQLPETGGQSSYYVRVVQADGHMAWSSPIWVVTA
jgi:hypothetical protein